MAPMGPTNPPIGRWVRDPLMNRSLARERGRERRGRRRQKGIPAAAAIDQGRRQQRGRGFHSESEEAGEGFRRAGVCLGGGAGLDCFGCWGGG